MDTRKRSRARPAPERRGFTLIELLIALVVSSLLAGVVFELFLGQGRFARLQTAREEVQQNARAAIDILVSELRGVGSEGVTFARADTLEFWSPRVWGIVCDSRPDEITVLFPSAALGSLPTTANGTDRLAFEPVGDAITWSFEEVTDVTSGRVNDARTRCLTLNPDPFPAVGSWTDSRARIFSSGDYTNGVEHLLAGSAVYLVDPVRYAAGPSAPGNEIWIKRNVGAGAPQPMAGPVAAVGGLLFRYFDGDGNEIATPVAVADLERITSIEVSVETQSRATFNNLPQTDRASTVVYLRNR